MSSSVKRIQRLRERCKLSAVPTEKLFVMYAHFYREARHSLPERKFRNDDEVRGVRARRLPSSNDSLLAEFDKLLPQQKKLTKTLQYFQDSLQLLAIPTPIPERMNQIHLHIIPEIIGSNPKSIKDSVTSAAAFLGSRRDLGTLTRRGL
jgi:hypothetical protein